LEQSNLLDVEHQVRLIAVYGQPETFNPTNKTIAGGIHASEFLAKPMTQVTLHSACPPGRNTPTGSKLLMPTCLQAGKQSSRNSKQVMSGAPGANASIGHTPKHFNIAAERNLNPVKAAAEPCSCGACMLLLLLTVHILALP
jgi:hypothetical protein